MEPQVMMPDFNFNFDSTSTSPFATAPSSPKYFGTFYYSAPASPTPTAPQDTKHIINEDDDDGDFAFDFSGQLERPFISADELFHGGKIRPLKPSPRLHLSIGSPRSILSPRRKKKDVHHFSEAFHPTLTAQTTKTSYVKKVSDILLDEGNNHKTSTNPSSSTITWYNKWNLKNLLLFRSTSEGSATTSKDPLKNYAMIRKDVNNSSVRSVDGGGPAAAAAGGSRRKMKRKVSAHEIHYTANRAVAEEVRRKTFLPYKSGLLGCLGFDNNGGSVRGII